MPSKPASPVAGRTETFGEPDLENEKTAREEKGAAFSSVLVTYSFATASKNSDISLSMSSRSSRLQQLPQLEAGD